MPASFQNIVALKSTQLIQWQAVVAGPSGMQAQSIGDGPSAPDLQLDWLSSSSDSDDTDDDSGIEVVSVQCKQSAQRVSSIGM
jgi:hypothetical protein